MSDETPPHPSDSYYVLRHLLATLAYRTSRAISDPPAGYPELSIGEGVRTPHEILAHLVVLLQFTLRYARGEQLGKPAPPRSWNDEFNEFFATLLELDELFASGEDIQEPDRLIQGPIADALTHVGQLAMLRRIAGDPVERESYAMADIQIGRVGPDQPPPWRPG